MASSQKIILNADGSVKLTILGNYIQKGNDGVDDIYIGVVGLPSSVSGVANFELPNGDTNTIVGVYQAQISDGQGSSYAGFKFTLTQAQTLYEGDVKMSLQLTDTNSNVLYSYASLLTINPAIMTPSEQKISQAQWNSLVSSLAGYQLQFANTNVRGYQSLAEAQTDIPNLAINQIVIYKSGTNWTIGVSNGSAITTLIVVSENYLSLDGGTLTNGGFKIGTDQWGDELISAPINRKILVNDSTGEYLINFNDEEELEIHWVASPVLDKDATNKSYVDIQDTNTYNQSKAYTDSKFNPLSLQVGSLDANQQIIASYIPSDTSDTNKLVNKNYVDSKLVNIYTYKGSVATYNDLPADITISGWVYNVESTGDNYASLYDGGVLSWDKLGGSIDLSNYYTKAQTDAEIADNIGKLLQLDFTGTLISGDLMFEPTGDTTINASDLVDNSTYELDLHFAGVSLSNAYTMSIKLSDNTIISLSSILGSGSVGSFKQLEKFNVDTGYRWVFNAVYNTTNGVHAFGIPATIVKPEIISVADEDLVNAIGTNDYEEGQLLFISSVGNGNGYILGSTYKVVYSAGVVDSYIDLTTDLMISITHANLLAKVNAGTLIAGQEYRITDYTCTTSTIDTQSAGHQFDIIVKADSSSVLNENARAIIHSGDTYFANAKLSAWELKYSITNDTTRFAWAVSTGKGVIYWMKDEFSNECPYDFKNIQFKRYVVSDASVGSILGDLTGKYLGFLAGEWRLTNGDEFIWCYTFSRLSNLNVASDYSLISTETAQDDYSLANELIKGCRNNVILDNKIIVSTDNTNYYALLSLNNIVFQCQDDGGDTPHYDMINSYFETNCLDMTFYNGDNIKTGESCKQIVGWCYSSTFKDRCYDMTFGNGCYHNAFGYNNYQIIFSGCGDNTFGNDCNSNTFGNGCYDNTFGNYCYDNTFGNGCNSNTFGNYCNYIDFTNNGSSNNFGDYTRYVTVDNGVKWVKITSATQGSSSSFIQNVYIHQGVGGSTNNYKVITMTRNNQFNTDVRTANDVVIH